MAKELEYNVTQRGRFLDEPSSSKVGPTLHHKPAAWEQQLFTSGPQIPQITQTEETETEGGHGALLLFLSVSKNLWNRRNLRTNWRTLGWYALPPAQTAIDTPLKL